HAKLSRKNRPPRRNLVWLGIAVLRWTTLDDIENVDLLSPQADSSDDTVQELTGCADKWFPLHVLIVPWRFPDEHERCRRVTRAKHHLRAPAMQAAFATVMHCSSELRQTYGRLGISRCALGGQCRNCGSCCEGGG